MNINIKLDDKQTTKLKHLASVTSGNMVNFTVGGFDLQHEVHRLSATNFAQSLLVAAIDRAYSQLPQ
tara:strand:- start:1867 stop:2067 length:201 start_codon:yes stop_codon:yes gene_type:complete